MKRFALALIRLYQTTISQVTPPSCRFVPSCSHYAYGAIQRHGVVKGIWLAAGRLARCHPFSPGGYDPVPGAQHRHPLPKEMKARHCPPA